MTTIGEMIQAVQSVYSKGLQSRDTRLTPRHIYFALSAARATLINQVYNKKQKISDWAYQPLPCIELIKAPTHECVGLPGTKNRILRSKYKIPKPITGIDKHLFQSVTTIDGDIKFDEVKFHVKKYSVGNKYTSKKAEYFIKDDYLYLTIISELRGISIVGLFGDMIEAYNFPSLCPCTSCCGDIMDLEFRFDDRLTTPLIQIARDELVVIMKQVTEDKVSNASDDTGTTGSMIHTPQNPQ